MPPVAGPPPAAQARREPSVSTTFSHGRYRFTTGLPAGEIATILDGSDATLLTYRSFSSILGVVAMLMTAIVGFAGAAAVVFLVAEQQLLRAAAAAVLTAVFTWFITLLVPRTTVTLFGASGQPELTISQTSMFPSARWLVTTPDGNVIGEIRRAALSRLGRHRWVIARERQYLAEANEQGFVRALFRKVAGKFSRRFETNVLITSGPIPAGRIVRRRENGQADFLELTGDVLDPRLAVALATIVLGSEP